MLTLVELFFCAIRHRKSRNNLGLDRIRVRLCLWLRIMEGLKRINRRFHLDELIHIEEKIHIGKRIDASRCAYVQMYLHELMNLHAYKLGTESSS